MSQHPGLCVVLNPPLTIALSQEDNHTEMPYVLEFEKGVVRADEQERWYAEAAVTRWVLEVVTAWLGGTRLVDTQALAAVWMGFV